MKKINLFFLTCLFLIMANVLSARTIVNSSRHNGGLFGYNNVKQIYLGDDQAGNRHWSLTCRNPGFTSCKIHISSLWTGNTPREVEISGIETANYHTASAWLDNQIDTNNVNSGSVTKHYQTTLSDNTVLNTYVKIVWALKAGTTDEHEVEFEIWSV